MVERELGLFFENGEPKPVAHVMKRMDALLARLPSPFPKRKSDGVCLLSRGQAQQAVAISALTLGKQAGIDLDVAYTENGDFPEAPLYFLPMITGWQVIYKKTWSTLLERVRAGATLYISYGGGQITDFPEIVGALSRGFLAGKSHTVRIGACEIPYCAKEILLSPTTAEVLLENEDKNPVLLKNRYGKGCVYFCNLPAEALAYEAADGFNAYAFYKIYRGNNRSGLNAPFVAEKRHLRLFSWTPKPDGIGFEFAFSGTFYVEGVIVENIVAFLH
jgi:hypothetical protein